MLILIVLISLMLAYILLCEVPKPKPKLKREHSNNRFLVPKEFWEDSNRLEIWIYDMTLKDAEKVRFKIQQFCDKYEQISEHKTFNLRVAAMLENYKRRHSYLLTNKN
jgi:hypothetical protein